MTDPYARPARQQYEQGNSGPGYPAQQPGQPAQAPPTSYPPMGGAPAGYGMAGYGMAGYGMAPQRPGTVLAGAIMTYIGGGLLVLLAFVVLVGVAAGGDEFAAGFTEGAGLDADPATVQAGAIGAGIGLLVQGTLLIVAAAFAQRGRNGWRITLTVIGGLNVLFGIVQVATGQPAEFLALAYVVGAVVLFWVGDANAWYRAQRALR